MPRLKPSPQIIEPVLTGRQLAICHGVRTETIRRWAEAGYFASYRVTPGNQIEVTASNYQAFIERHTIKTKSQ